MFGLICFGIFCAWSFGGGKLDRGSGSSALGGVLGGILGSYLVMRKQLEDIGWIKPKDEKEKEKNTKRLKKLLDKDPEDLTDEEKVEIRKLSKNVDTDDLTDKQLDSLNKYKNREKYDEDDEKTTKADEKKLLKNKGLALAQREIKKLENDNSDEAIQTRKDYESLMKCMFDENGKELSDEEFEKSFNNLDKSIQDRIQKSAKNLSKDEKALEEFKKEAESITNEEAAAALENAKATRLEITKKEKIEKQEEDRKKELEGVSGEDEKKKINEKHDNLISSIKTSFDAKIKAFKEKAASISEIFKKDIKADAAKKKIKELEEKKKELDGDKYNSNLLKKYKEFDFGELDKGAIDGTTSGGEDDKKKAEEKLKDAGLDPELYRKIAKASSEKKDDKEKTDADLLEELGEDLAKDKDRRKKELDSEIEKQQKIINDYKTSKSTETKTNKDTTNDNPKMTDNEVALLNNDGEPTGEKIVKKEYGTFKKVDKEGNESNATEDDWKDARSEFQDSDWEGDEDNSDEDNNADKDLDTNQQEDEEDKKDTDVDRDENGKRMNPAKVWHRKKKKNGKGSTKGYYNKKGNSISAKDFKEKMSKFKSYVKKHKKQTNESLLDYLTDKLILERFYPQDISLLNSFRELDLSAYIKSKLEE